MKKKLRNLLAYLLALMLIESSGGFSPLQVFAETAKKPIEPKALTKTTDSIVLDLQKDFVYAIRIEKEKKEESTEQTDKEEDKQEKIWKWAEPEQYDSEKSTVTFKNLKADTEYEFTCRPKDSQEETELKAVIIRTLAEISKTEPEPAVTEPPKTEPEPTVTQPPKTEPEPAVTEPPKTEPEPAVTQPPKTEPEPTVTEPPKTEPEPAVTQPPKTEPEPAVTEPPKTEPEPAVTQPPKTEPEPTVTEPPKTEPEPRFKPDVPNSPELQSYTDTNVVLKKIKGQEYAILSEKQEPVWNDDSVFNELRANTEYRFIARIKGTEDTDASDPSKPLILKTKASAAQAPDAPKPVGRGEDFITLEDNNNLEFAISTDGKNWKWQEASYFTGLKSQTAYHFAAKAKFNPETEMPSLISSSTICKTYVTFNGCIKGIAPGGTYKKYTELTASAEDVSMNIQPKSPGDTRWIPRTWNWDGKTNRTWSTEPYNVSFKLNKAGDYKLTVGFELEEYTETGWKALGNFKAVSVSFKAVNPIYTITSSAGRHGTISPDGHIEAEEGKDVTFTFKPDKNYYVKNVWVDDISVKFKDNKFTFSNITGNHKISVEFEAIDGTTAPKTGDTSLFTAAFILMTMSAVLFITLNIVQKKKNR